MAACLRESALLPSELVSSVKVVAFGSSYFKKMVQRALSSTTLASEREIRKQSSSLGSDAASSSHQRKTLTARVVSNLICGATAGAVAKTLEAPLDRVKVIYQVDSTPFTWTHAMSRARTMVAEDGWLSLFRGNTAQLARIVPNAAINFAAHDLVAEYLDEKANNLPLAARHWLSGCVAGAVAVLTTYPLELARVRIAVSGRGGRGGDEHGPANLKEAVREMTQHWRRGGPRGPFAGVGLTLAGMVPYSGVTWASYEWLRSHAYSSGLASKQSSDRTNAVCGALAGLLGQTVTYPIDTVRKRLQATKQSATKLPSTYAVTTEVLATEGVRGLFKGYSVNIVKAPLALGTSFAVYHKLQTVAHDMMNNE